ncbi:unnamed protein product [Nesidiocoris tenuis]|uniref:Uncharacterized protein n=1 Tax=Nesidiocoris tenuis TaxID=355587 RepID=A0A6H5FYJ7_9HEMI|nr:unnamed protein product [Nesidiocoris tenuis]
MFQQFKVRKFQQFKVRQFHHANNRIREGSLSKESKGRSTAKRIAAHFGALLRGLFLIIFANLQ